MDWRTALRTQLAAASPAGVCALDAAALAFAGETLPAIAVAPAGAPAPQPCSLALGIDALNGLDARAAEALIHRTRLYVAPRLLLVAHADCALDEAAFLALGFELAAHDTAAGVRLHAFDLDTYKTVPDWLNARFWANPERWEP
ncbi:MAG: DUF6231 family protein [Gammaproteobacteria bacterium]